MTEQLKKKKFLVFFFFTIKILFEREKSFAVRVKPLITKVDCVRAKQKNFLNKFFSPVTEKTFFLCKMVKRRKLVSKTGIFLIVDDER